ncbi:hypothetical protein [Kineococcus sp. TRM81007]|uniref:hypothetical protein n=1 Tax=Kineococcus sp. TRM81007 TaxID=2925831 RepID=UPI0027E227C7|nr:hypothetical protein [Kineococcus sp. TRM81007]
MRESLLERGLGRGAVGLLRLVAFGQVSGSSLASVGTATSVARVLVRSGRAAGRRAAGSGGALRLLRRAGRPRALAPRALAPAALSGTVVDRPRQVSAPASPVSLTVADRPRQGVVQLVLGREPDAAAESLVVEVRRGDGTWRPAGAPQPVAGAGDRFALARPAVPGRYAYRVACARHGVVSEACADAVNVVLVPPAPPASLAVSDDAGAGVVVLDLGRELDPAVESVVVEVRRDGGAWVPVPGGAAAAGASAVEVARPVEPGSYAYRAAVTAGGAASPARTDRTRVLVAPARLGGLRVEDLPGQGLVRLTPGRAVDLAREELVVEVRRGRSAWVPVPVAPGTGEVPAVLVPRPAAAGSYTYRASVCVAGACSDKPTATDGKVVVAPRPAGWLKVRNPRTGTVEFLLHPVPAEDEAPVFEVRRGEGAWRVVSPAPVRDDGDAARFTAASPAAPGRYAYRVAVRAFGATSAPVEAETEFTVHRPAAR